MAAPDIETLYAIEEALEDRLKAILATADLGPGYTQREQEKLPKQRIDIQVTLGAEFGHYFKTPSGKWVNDLWNFSCRFMIVHDRSKQKKAGKTKADDFIATQKKKLRSVLAPWPDLFTIGSLPYHEIRAFRDQVTSPTLAPSDDLDLSTLNFNGVVGIRSDAWPA